jgi:hypothetical protein
MLGLVQTKLTASWKPNLGHRSPASLFHLGALNAPVGQCPHFAREVIAHEVQLGPSGLGWMNGELGRRQTEDQPPATGIDVIEAENVGHEGAIGVSVAAEDHDVGTEDHRARLP